MSRHLFCPVCGVPLDTYTQTVHTKKQTFEVDFGTCRVDGCSMEGMTLSADTWQRFLSEPKLLETYGIKAVNYNPLTGERIAR